MDEKVHVVPPLTLKLFEPEYPHDKLPVVVPLSVLLPLKVYVIIPHPSPKEMAKGSRV